jgi:signal recognition particle GTPase
MMEDYNLADYRIDLHRLQQMGGSLDVAGLGTGVYDGVPFEEWPATLACLQRLLDAMTVKERRDPACMGSEEIQRLAATTGTAPEEAERAVRHFKRVPDAMRRLARLSVWERIKVLTKIDRFPRAQ